MHRRHLAFLLYPLALCLFGLALFIVLRDKKFVHIIKNIPLYIIALSALFSLLLLLIQGLQLYYLCLSQFGARIEMADVALLPAMMGLLGYLFPFRGGLLFSVFFFKMKYGLSMTAGSAIGIYSIMVQLALTGVVGIVFGLTNGQIVSPVIIVSMLLLISPLSAKPLGVCIGELPAREGGRCWMIKNKVADVFLRAASIFQNWKTAMVVSGINILAAAAYSAWLFWATRIFHVQLGVDTVVFLSVLSRLVFIFNLLPGNFGLQELTSGGMFVLAGATVQEGILVSLFLRVSGLLMVVLAGTGGLMMNMKYFSMNPLKALWSEVKSGESRHPE